MESNEPSSYLIIWEFRVRRGFEAQFEQTYGASGEWVRLFRTGDGYIRTELLRDHTTPGRYLTVDIWRSRADYDAFREQHAHQYQRIDEICEQFTERELSLGAFENVRSGPLML